MSETIDATSQEFPGFFVIAAITQAVKETGCSVPCNPVEVSLLVNGVEIPFTKTMNDIYRRMEEQVDGEARGIAEKMVTEAGLEGVADALREVERKVKDALSRVKGQAT